MNFLSSSNKRITPRRLFFALWPTESIRKVLAEIARDVHCKGLPVPTRNFHITLVFLGPVDANRQGCVERMAEKIEGVPFNIRLDELGCFPRAGIVWLGASKTPLALHSLVSKLNQDLADCGFTPEKRFFRF
uniref:2'-5' RNA ligase n=1 Tax=Candidatus Kentrum sp. TUN TaxID=2126343 RepID=A0A451A019_9GAMM|nr:MAG: 2'-5' RNA ligase [Candidatus Kentron sp. TUN]